MKSIFEKIANREMPGHIVWEDDTHIAFLTIEPLSEGHTLVVPKKNIGDNLFQLSESDYLSLMKASYQVAKLLEEKLQVDRVLMSVEGLEVPHVHVHLVPSYGKGFEHHMHNKTNKDNLVEVLKKVKG